ncbi:MAG: two-component regulator propeller domain-containing protein [Crocinitomicaceae bacterium]
MLKTIIFIVSLTTLSSCKGIHPPEENVSTRPTIGTKIESLGKRVARVFQDSKNNYWFAHEGIVKYDGKNLIQFTMEDGLYANRVRDIQEDHLGNIYFDTGEGINKYDGTSIEKLTPITNSEKAKDLHPTDLWFAGNWNMNGVYRYDGKDLYRLKMPKHELDEEANQASPNSSFSFYTNYSTFKDHLGNAWMGGAVFGACRFDGSNFFWISEREMTEIDPGPAMGVRSIVQDKDGCFYFASNINSKYRVVELDGVTTYEKLPGIDTSLEPEAYSACISMEIDNKGNFWMTQYEGGVWKYDGKSFSHYPVLINKEEAQVFSIYKDRNGVLWVGTHNAGVWKFNGKGFERFTPKIAKE